MAMKSGRQRILPSRQCRYSGRVTTAVDCPDAAPLGAGSPWKALSKLLRVHPVESAEVFPSVSDQRTIARMVDRFHAGDGFHLARFVLVDVLDQLGLGVGRAGDENRIGFG